MFEIASEIVGMTQMDRDRLASFARSVPGLFVAPDKVLAFLGKLDEMRSSKGDVVVMTATVAKAIPSGIENRPKAIETAAETQNGIEKALEDPDREQDPATAKALEVAQADPTKGGPTIDGWEVIPCSADGCDRHFQAPPLSGRRPSSCWAHIQSESGQRRRLATISKYLPA